MSILADKTETAAIKMIARNLKYFDNLANLKMTAEDAFIARSAENQIKDIIETNGYKTAYKAGKGIIIKKAKSKEYGKG